MNSPQKRILDELINLREENKKLQDLLEDRERYIENIECDKSHLYKSNISYKSWNTKLRNEIADLKTGFDLETKSYFKDFTNEINKTRALVNEYYKECSSLRSALKRGEHDYLFRKFKDIIKDIPSDIKSQLNHMALFMKPVEANMLKNFNEIYDYANHNIEYKRMGIIDLIVENLEDE